MSVFTRRRRSPGPALPSAGRRALTAAPGLAANDAPTEAIQRPAGPTLGELAATGEIPPHPFMPGRVPVACRCGQPKLAAIHHAPPPRRPSFTPLAQTSRDLPHFLPAVIGDSLDPRPSWEDPPEPEPGTSPVLYARTGWTRALTAVRKRNGELDELPKLVEAGLGRNAAEFHTALRHAREGITEGAVRLCADLGCLDMAGELLRRVQYYSAHPDVRDGRAA